MNAPAKAFNHIIQQMADNASFLWVLRDRQRREPNVYPEHIKELDERIQANLDGLLLYGEEAWAIAQANGEFTQGGEAFCLGYLAFSGENVSKIQYATEFALQNSDTFKGLASSLAWLPGPKIHPWITQFFHSKNLDHKRLALAACRLRQEDPAGFLTQIFEREDCLNHLGLMAEALRCIGAFNRADLNPFLAHFAAHPDEEVQFWANACGLFLGQLHCVQALQPFIASEHPRSKKALSLVFASLPIETARQWIGVLLESGDLRAAITACGILGDPGAVDWLIQHMHDPKLARLAGFNFYRITGLNLRQMNLIQEPPANDTDEAEDILNDDNLDWPNPEAVAACFFQHASNFTAGQRYWLGSPRETLTPPSTLPHVLMRELALLHRLTAQ